MFLILFALLFLCAWAFQVDAWARAGGGGSMGSRGSRSMAAPTPYTAPTTPSALTHPALTPRPALRPPAGPSPREASCGASAAACWAAWPAGCSSAACSAGLRPRRHGAGATGGGGIGLIDILLLAGIAYLIYWYIKKKRQEADATAGYYQSSGNVELPPQPQYPPVYDQPQAAAPGSDQDLERGLANIRQFDPYFRRSQIPGMGHGYLL